MKLKVVSETEQRTTERIDKTRSQFSRSAKSTTL